MSTTYGQNDIEALVDKIEQDLYRIQCYLKAGLTTESIAQTATDSLQGFQIRLTEALEVEQRKGTLKTKRSLRNLAKGVLKLITKVKVETGTDPVAAAEAEQIIMAKFELDSKIASEGAVTAGSNERPWKSTIDLSQMSSAYLGDGSHPSQASQFVPSMPSYWGNQSISLLPQRKLTSKSTVSLRPDEESYTSSRQVSRSGIHYAASRVPSSSSYAYPREYNTVQLQKSDYENQYSSKRRNAFELEPGSGRNTDARRAAYFHPSIQNQGELVATPGHQISSGIHSSTHHNQQRSDDASYSELSAGQATNYYSSQRRDAPVASYSDHREREYPNMAIPSTGRYSTDAQSFASSSSSLLTMEFASNDHKSNQTEGSRESRRTVPSNPSNFFGEEIPFWTKGKARQAQRNHHQDGQPSTGSRHYFSSR